MTSMEKPGAGPSAGSRQSSASGCIELASMVQP
jgi:hypothetical protein